MPLNDLPKIDELRQFVGCHIVGVYRLSSIQEKISNAGHSRLQLELDDCTGTISGIVWPEYRTQCQGLKAPSFVYLEGDVREFDGRLSIHVRLIHTENPDVLSVGAQLLPRRLCPTAALPGLNHLVSLEDRLEGPMQGFLRRVLLDPEIGVPFMRCRGSVRHHHSMPGGLLAHSTAVLDLVMYAVLSALPDDHRSLDIAQIAYLLHDVGKIRTVGESRRPVNGLVVRHEIQSVKLLAPHLKWLEGRDPELSVGLEYVLDYIATPAKARGYAKYLVAEIVAAADQWSAAAHNGRDLGSLLSCAGAHPERLFGSAVLAANDSLIDDGVTHGN
ncbi:MAG: hypothetical protein M3O62_04105 [Pseudomonadota bacterium]|nr:hypothetical protein [Pseudomonadota bacterium]